MTTLGYMRISTTEQDLALQRDAILAAGVEPDHIYQDVMSGKRDDRPGLEACLKALRKGDVLVVWRLDRLGRSTKHLIETVENLEKRGVEFKTLTGFQIDTTGPMGKFVFTLFAALAELERGQIRDRTMAGLASARARGRVGGRPRAMTKAKVRLAQSSMGQPGTNVAALCRELSVSQATLYQYVSPEGELRDAGKKVMEGR